MLGLFERPINKCSADSDYEILCTIFSRKYFSFEIDHSSFIKSFYSFYNFNLHRKSPRAKSEKPVSMTSSHEVRAHWWRQSSPSSPLSSYFWSFYFVASYAAEQSINHARSYLHSCRPVRCPDG